MGSWAGGLRAYGALSPPYVLIVIQNRSVTIYPVRSAFVWGWGGSLNPFYSCYYFFSFAGIYHTTTVWVVDGAVEGQWISWLLTWIASM